MSVVATRLTTELLSESFRAEAPRLNLQILQAGQWRSPAFLAYVDKEALEDSVVVEAHLDESSSDDEA